MTTTAPTTRSQQRLDTRDRIVVAAVSAFADKGFRGASTREIAQRAGTNQGLITYHFKSKDELWRAAADRTFEKLQTSLSERVATLASDDPRDRSREMVREYVRFVAAHPELFRLMVDEGKNSEDRMKWLVDTHLKPHFEKFTRVGSAAPGGADPLFAPHAYYVLAGASSLIFAVAPECRRLTGVEPESEEVIERHADYVARLLVP